MAEQFQTGDRLQDRWEILRVLEGQTYNTLVVFDHKLNRSLAAKVLQEKAISPVSTKNFADAAQAWIKLGSHANIPKAHFVEVIRERQFLFTDYVGGGLVVGLPQELPYVLVLAINLCDAMSYAAEKGLAVHGHIKPQNCLITRDGLLKLADFGMGDLLNAHAEGGVAPALLATRMFKKIATGVFRAKAQPASDQAAPPSGDKMYLAPELVDTPQRRTAKSDLYSFGVLVCELITGQTPFGDGNGAQSLSSKSQHLGELVQACLAKNPSDRPANFSIVREQLAALHKTLTGKSVPAPDTGAELELIEAARESTTLRDLGLDAKATVYFNTALKQCPPQASILLNLGSRLRRMSNWVDAVQCYERVIELERNNAAAIAGKGIALLQDGQTDKASDCADRAIEQAPENDDALVLMGMIWTTVGRTQAASEYFDKALNVNLNNADAWLQKGKLLKVDQPGESIESFEKVIALNPRHDEAWIMKGEVMGQLQRPRDEVNCYDHALEINPQNAEAWYRKGMALCGGLNRYQEAMVCLAEAQKLGHPNAADGIATCKPLLEFMEKTNTYTRIQRPAQ